MTVNVCIGSACHIKGSYNIINKLQSLISEHSLDNQVEIRAAFCLQECGQGVSVKVDDGPVHFLNQDNVKTFFTSKILEQLNK